MNIIAKVRTGSKLTGLATEHSDDDFVVIYAPELHDLVMGVRLDVDFKSTSDANSKNTKDDTDTTHIPIQKFVNKLLAGDMGSVELLYASDAAVLELSCEIWNVLVAHRDLLLRNNITQTIRHIDDCTASFRANPVKEAALAGLAEYLTTIPAGRRVSESVYDLVTERPDDFVKSELPNGREAITVEGRQIPYKAPMSEVRTVVDSAIKRYGKKGVMSSRNWVTLANAHRCALQTYNVLSHGHIFNFESKQTMLDIKAGIADIDKTWQQMDYLRAKLSSATRVCDEDKAVLTRALQCAVYNHYGISND